MNFYDINIDNSSEENEKPKNGEVGLEEKGNKIIIIRLWNKSKRFYNWQLKSKYKKKTNQK